MGQVIQFNLPPQPRPRVVLEQAARDYEKADARAGRIVFAAIVAIVCVFVGALLIAGVAVMGAG